MIGLLAAVALTWAQAALPYTNTLDASLASQAGGGEQIAWRPEMGGASPCVANPAGYNTMWALRLTAADHAAIARYAASLNTPAATLATAQAAKWKACFFESAQALSGDYTVSQALLPAGGASSWSGAWTYASDVAYRATRAEIDFAEVTNNADGSMYVRQQLHGIDPVTKAWSTWPAKGCPTTFPKRQIITAGYRIRSGVLTFTMNGKNTCSITIPAGLDVPQHLIDSNMVGGAAPASTIATPNAYMNVWSPVVTTP